MDDLTEKDLSIIEAAFSAWHSEGCFGGPKDITMEDIAALLTKVYGEDSAIVRLYSE